MLETIDPEATVPGERQTYITGVPSGGNPTRSYLPAIVMSMRFDLSKAEAGDDREVCIGSLRV